MKLFHMKIKACSLESRYVHPLIECRRLLGCLFTSWQSEEKVPDFFTASGISGEVSVLQLLPQHWEFPPSPQSGPAPLSVFLQVTCHNCQQHRSHDKNSSCRNKLKSIVGHSASQFCVCTWIYHSWWESFVSGLYVFTGSDMDRSRARYKSDTRNRG